LLLQVLHKTLVTAVAVVAVVLELFGREQQGNSLQQA
jgi:hypothetical protein